MTLTQAQKAHVCEIQRVAGLCVDVFARAQAVLFAEQSLDLTRDLTQKDLDAAGLQVDADDLRAAIAALEANQDKLVALIRACVKVRTAEINRL